MQGAIEGRKKSVFAGETKPDYSIENGSYPARLFQIVQLGSQHFEKNGRDWYSPQVLIGFELPQFTYEDANGETVTKIVSGVYFLTMNQSRPGMFGLRELVDSMRGSETYSEEELKQFDITEFLGKEFLVTLDGVESKGNIYQNIVKVVPMTFASQKVNVAPGTLRQLRLITIEDFANIEQTDLPNWIKDKIKMSKEYREMLKDAPTTYQESSKLQEAAANDEISLDDEDEIRLEDVPF